jgi:hypothetical protein
VTLPTIAKNNNASVPFSAAAAAAAAATAAAAAFLAPSSSSSFIENSDVPTNKLHKTKHNKFDFIIKFFYLKINQSHSINTIKDSCAKINIINMQLRQKTLPDSKKTLIDCYLPTKTPFRNKN